MRYKIAFFSGSRADFGLIQSIVKKAIGDKRFDPYLIRLGHSFQSEKDFNSLLKDDLKVIAIKTRRGINNIKEEVETPLAVSEIISMVSKKIVEIKPDIVFIPGDRFEIFAAAISSYYLRIPIAHIFGGDKSSGGHLDDNIRNAISKISHFHFPVSNDSAKRLIKMGESPDRVFNFGSPVVDNVKEIKFKRPFDHDYALLTFHPITVKPEDSYREMKILLKTISDFQFRIKITSPNNEMGSEGILKAINEFVNKKNNIGYIGNLGWHNYLNAVKYSLFCIGNSSSNLLEAPILGKISINVGERQLGRFSPKSVIHCDCEKDSITKAIEKVLSVKKFSFGHPYGKGKTGERILNTLYNFLNGSDKKELLIKPMAY